MEMLVILIALGVFIYLSMRFGYDSRARIPSKEEELASFGLIWDQPTSHLEVLRREAALARQLQQLTAAASATNGVARLTRRQPPAANARRALARRLRALAHRLSPQVA
jgi:hypothetical protein